MQEPTILWQVTMIHGHSGQKITVIAKVSVTTDDGTELANEADHHISSEASVTFEDVKLDTAGISA